MKLLKIRLKLRVIKTRPLEDINLQNRFYEKTGKKKWLSDAGDEEGSICLI